MTDCVMVWTTLGADVDALALAHTLVAERLAACVSVQAPMDSVYRWEGGVQQDRERQLVIKTTTERLPALTARVGQLHPYDTAEWLVTPVIEGGREYLAWLRASVAQT